MKLNMNAAKRNMSPVPRRRRQLLQRVVVEEGGEEEGGEGEGEDVVYVLGDENEIHGPYTLAVRFFLCF